MFRIIVHFSVGVIEWPRFNPFLTLVQKTVFLICIHQAREFKGMFNVFFGGDGESFAKSHMAGGLSSDACARVCFWIAIMMALELSFSLRQKLMKQMADCCFSSSNTSTLEIWILVSIRNLPFPYVYTSIYVFFVNFFWHQVSLCLHTDRQVRWQTFEAIGCWALLSSRSFTVRLEWTICRLTTVDGEDLAAARYRKRPDGGVELLLARRLRSEIWGAEDQSLLMRFDLSAASIL